MTIIHLRLEFLYLCHAFSVLKMHSNYTSFKIKLTFSYELSLSNVEPNFYFPPNVEHCANFLSVENSQRVSNVYLNSEMVATDLTCYDIYSFDNFTDVGADLSLMIHLIGQNKLLLKNMRNMNSYW